MIVLDTSAIIAVINREPERQRFLEIIAAEDRCLISAVSLLEARLVTYGRYGDKGADALERWLDLFAPEVIDFDKAQSDAAFSAFVIYGKGNNPRARLNFGDCAAYALAQSRNLALLFKGNDFTATDIRPAA